MQGENTALQRLFFQPILTTHNFCMLMKSISPLLSQNINQDKPLHIYNPHSLVAQIKTIYKRHIYTGPFNRSDQRAKMKQAKPNAKQMTDANRVESKPGYAISGFYPTPENTMSVRLLFWFI